MKKLLLLSLFCFITSLANAEPLPANDVFKVDVKIVDQNTFIINWQIRPEYFLYSDRIKLTEPADSNFNLGALRFPPTQGKTDKLGRKYTVYRNQLSLSVPILGNKPGESILSLHFQGCADDGFCYPPEVKEIKVAIDDKLALSMVDLEPSNTFLKTENTVPEDDITLVFLNHSWAAILLIFFGFGLLLSFTPCVLPMIPVLSGIIIGHGKDLTTRKAFFLSYQYASPPNDRPVLTNPAC